MAKKSDKKNAEIVQELLDTGMTRYEISIVTGLNGKVVNRLIRQYGLEFYKSFDEEEDTVHLYQNFEWLWEEDKLEEITNAAFFAPVYINREDDDIKALSIYVKRKYSNLKKYLNNKNLHHLLTEIFLYCKTCDRYRSVAEFTPHKNPLMGLDTRCNDCLKDVKAEWFQNNKDYHKIYTHNRTALEKYLPNSLKRCDIDRILSDFSNACAMTRVKGSNDLDHFIPLCWGHGGSYYGNIYPLHYSLNRSKNGRNPFAWFEIIRREKGLEDENLYTILHYLASINGLNVDEYISFVNWCYENKRTVDEVRQDQRPSIEIWREATGLQFPIRVDFANPNEIGNRLETA